MVRAPSRRRLRDRACAFWTPERVEALAWYGIVVLAYGFGFVLLAALAWSGHWDHLGHA